MPRRYRRETGRLPVHKAFAKLRYALGWNTQRMAMEIGITKVSYSQIECGATEVSLWVIERTRVVTGIDPYMLAYSLYYDSSSLPPDVQKPIKALRSAWERAIELMHRCKQLLPGQW